MEGVTINLLLKISERSKTFPDKRPGKDNYSLQILSNKKAFFFFFKKKRRLDRVVSQQQLRIVKGLPGQVRVWHSTNKIDSNKIHRRPTNF